MSGQRGRTIEQRIIDKARRFGGSASRHELTTHLFDKFERVEARKVLDAMAATGSLHRFIRPAASGRGNPAQQYFLDYAAGEQWAAATNPQPRHAVQPKAKASYKAVPLTVSDKRVRTLSATLPADAPVIVPANVKRTVGPTHAFDARYCLDPSTRIVGGFSSMGVGRYLEMKR